MPRTQEKRGLEISGAQGEQATVHHSSDAEFGPGHLRERALMVLSTTLSFLNTVFKGIKVKKNLNMAQKSHREPGWLVVVDVCFAVAFMFEFSLRWQDCLLERRAGLDRVRFF